MQTLALFCTQHSVSDVRCSCKAVMFFLIPVAMGFTLSCLVSPDSVLCLASRLPALAEPAPVTTVRRTRGVHVSTIMFLLALSNCICICLEMSSQPLSLPLPPILCAVSAVPECWSDKCNHCSEIALVTFMPCKAEKSGNWANISANLRPAWYRSEFWSSQGYTVRPC